MKQLILDFSIMGRTYVVLVEIVGGEVKVKRTDLGKGVTIERLIEYFRGYNLPIFVDPSYPEVRDVLKKYGHWVLS